MSKKSSGEVKLGRPLTEDRGEIIRRNGFSQAQWEWYQKEAKAKGMTTMALARVALQWWIDSVEAHRVGSLATPEDDQKYENLISSNSNNHKKKKKKE